MTETVSIDMKLLGVIAEIRRADRSVQAVFGMDGSDLNSVVPTQRPREISAFLIRKYLANHAFHHLDGSPPSLFENWFHADIDSPRLDIPDFAE